MVQVSTLPQPPAPLCLPSLTPPHLSPLQTKFRVSRIVLQLSLLRYGRQQAERIA